MRTAPAPWPVLRLELVGAAALTVATPDRPATWHRTSAWLSYLDGTDWVKPACAARPVRVVRAAEEPERDLAIDAGHADAAVCPHCYPR